jgi:hypothetical protein
MRIQISLLALSTALLASCAYQGTVVQKDAMAHPFYLSQGIDGKYAFILEDKAGVRHRQLVTPEVYERYAVGDYFDDTQMAAGTMTDDSKNMQRTAPVMTASAKSRAATQRLAVTTAKAKASRLAAAKSAKKTKSLAAKAKSRKRAVAKRKNSKPAVKPVTIAAIAPAPQPATPVQEASSDFGVVTIARCR